MRPRLRNLGVRARLTGGFVLVCALIGALDCVGITGLQRVQRTYAFAEHEYAWACAAHRAKTALLEEVWAQKNYVLRGEKTDLRLTRERAAMVDARRAQLADLTAHPSDEAALQRLDEQIAVLRAVFERAAVVRKAKGTRAADALVRGRAAAALIALDPSITSAEQRAAAAALTAANVSDRTFLWTTLIVISVAVFAVAVGIGLSLSITRPVAWLRRAVDAVGAGREIDSRPASWFRDELTQVSDAFRELVQRASLLQEMETRSRRLEALSARVVRAQEEERGRIARELHDGLGQALTAIKFELSAAAAATDGRAEDVMDRLTSAQKLTRETLDEVRCLALDLRPPALDNLGLTAALRSYARQHAEWSATEASIDERNMEARLPPQVETALYRIAQEALANVAKHADAEHVWIELTRDGDEVTLVVRDDGRGMDVAALSGDKAAASGLGLLSMAQRAQELGGDLQLESAPGKGTTIRVHISVGEAK